MHKILKPFRFTDRDGQVVVAAAGESHPLPAHVAARVTASGHAAPAKADASAKVAAPAKAKRVRVRKPKAAAAAAAPAPAKPAAPAAS